jgi:hypothetical protein
MNIINPDQNLISKFWISNDIQNLDIKIEEMHPTFVENWNKVGYQWTPKMFF